MSHNQNYPQGIPDLPSPEESRQLEGNPRVILHQVLIKQRGIQHQNLDSPLWVPKKLKIKKIMKAQLLNQGNLLQVQQNPWIRVMRVLILSLQNLVQFLPLLVQWGHQLQNQHLHHHHFQDLIPAVLDLHQLPQVLQNHHLSQILQIGPIP